MKKGLCILLTMLCLVFLFGNSSAQAATRVVGDEYCGICGVKFDIHSEPLGSWTTSHTFDVNTSGGTRTYTCRVLCGADRVHYMCPNGHRSWYKDVETEVHTHPECKYH